MALTRQQTLHAAVRPYRDALEEALGFTQEFFDLKFTAMSNTPRDFGTQEDLDEAREFYTQRQDSLRHLRNALGLNTHDEAPAPTPAGSQVDHPLHYGGADDPYEVIKVAEAWGLDEDTYLFNVVKYIVRAGKKDPAKDLEDHKKARFYLDRKIARLEAKARERQRQSARLHPPFETGDL